MNENGGKKMRMVWKQKVRSCLLVGVLLAGLMVIALPAQVYADAAVEDFWNTAYSVDYDVTVSAPDGGVNLRYGAGVKYDKILEGMIPNGTVLHIRQVAKADNGKEWGYTTYNGLKGWIFLGQTAVFYDLLKVISRVKCHFIIILNVITHNADSPLLFQRSSQQQQSHQYNME